MKRAKWSVVCRDYTLRVGTREAAIRNRDEIERRGYCPNTHKILDPEGREVTTP